MSGAQRRRLHDRKPDAVAWVWATVGAASRPDLCFVQEVPSDEWLEAWVSAGYRVILGHRRGWQVRSAIVTLLGPAQLVSITPAQVPELIYHGEYLAAGQLLGWGAHGRPLTLFSVHASPNPAEAGYLAHHPDPERLEARDGGADPRDQGKLFDSDVVLDTVSRYPTVLACGDWNEARAWDDHHPGQTWGREFFGHHDDAGAVPGRVQDKGLVDVPLSTDGGEVVTRVAPGHPPLQLDHILISTSLAPRVTEARVDPGWMEAPGRVPGLADHAPIRFRILQP